jgi:hypothetical protein
MCLTATILIDKASRGLIAAPVLGRVAAVAAVAGAMLADLAAANRRAAMGALMAAVVVAAAAEIELDR